MTGEIFILFLAYYQNIISYKLKYTMPFELFDELPELIVCRLLGCRRRDVSMNGAGQNRITILWEAADPGMSRSSVFKIDSVLSRPVPMRQHRIPYPKQQNRVDAGFIKWSPV